MADLCVSPMREQQDSANATFGEEGGWEVPLHFGNLTGELRAARRDGAVFDLTSLGRLRIRGDGALDLLERVCTADVAHQEDDTAMRTLLCNEQGGILDECVLIRLANFWVLTTSSQTREKILHHLQAHATDDVKVDDQTEKVAHLAATGPKACERLARVLPMPIADFQPGQAKMGSLMVANYIALRMSYTGGWTLEVMVPNLFAAKAWEFITAESAGKNRLTPAGMLARDTLRLQSGHCCYGHELNETIDPFTAGLTNLLDFSHEFLGIEALRNRRDRKPDRRRVLLRAELNTMQPGQMPRQGTPILDSDGNDVGTVTSGGLDPDHTMVLTMGYLRTDLAESNAKLFLGVSGVPPAIHIERIFV